MLARMLARLEAFLVEDTDRCSGIIPILSKGVIKSKVEWCSKANRLPMPRPSCRRLGCFVYLPWNKRSLYRSLLLRGRGAYALANQ